MCGLVAIINSDRQRVDPHVLRSMADRIAHRGPDAEGDWHNGGVGLFHKRLSIIDIEAGAQPMTRSDVTVVFNGEIYNFIELREELEKLGHGFTTHSDTEVLLQAYLRYGPDFVRRLNGMFAFVLYDRRHDRVMAARDHFGIKPLYRCRLGGTVIYASEIKAILGHPEVEAAVDRAALDDYVTFQHTLGEHTLFSGIERVSQASFELFDVPRPDALKRTRYWKPDYTLNSSLTEDQAVEQLQHLLRESVRIQLRSDVPLGAYLSGGLDSSTVTLLAAAEYGDSLKTFTGAFREGLEFDESRYAADVAAQANADQHLIYPTEDDFVDSLSLLSHAMDEPAAGPGLFPQYMVSRLAADNVKVCLGGQGGDEIFGGYARYPIAYLETAILAAIGDEPVSSADGIQLQQLATKMPMLKQYKPMIRRFLSQGLFEAPERRYFFLLDRSAGVLNSLSTDLRESYQRESVFARFEFIFNDANTGSYLNRMTYFDLMASLPALLQVEDRVSMAVSLESRVPLLDPEIMNFIATVPPHIKWKDGEPKYLFKRAIQDWLPASVMERKDKMGFPVPLHLWAKGAAREFVCDTLLSRRCRERGLFDHDVVEHLIHNEEAFGRGLWGILQLELWHQNFIDKSRNQPLAGDQHAAVVH